MNNFDHLYSHIINEVNWKDILNAGKKTVKQGVKTAASKAISTAGKAAGGAIAGTGKLAGGTVAGASNAASKAVGGLGYAFGTGGKSIPGTAALQSGIQKTGSMVGSAATKASNIAGQAVAGTAAGVEKLGTKLAQNTTQARDDRVSQMLGISSKTAPKSGDTVGITLGKFAGKGLGVVAPKALLQKPQAYQGGLLFNVPVQNVKAGDKQISNIKIVYNPGSKDAARVFYYDKSGVQVQSPDQLGLPGTAMLKPNPDQQSSSWILTDRQPAEPQELNASTRGLKGQIIKKNQPFKMQLIGGKVQQFKALTEPDANGDFVAIPV